MSKQMIVVSVKRDRWFWPKLTIVIEARVPSAAAGEAFITKQVMAAYRKLRGKVRHYVQTKDYRVLDEVGLKRLRAAAKASATIRRKRGAKKAAVTRAKNKAARLARTARAREVQAEMRRSASPPEYFPATQGYEVAGDASVN